MGHDQSCVAGHVHDGGLVCLRDRRPGVPRVRRGAAVPGRAGHHHPRGVLRDPRLRQSRAGESAGTELEAGDQPVMDERRCDDSTRSRIDVVAESWEAALEDWNRASTDLDRRSRRVAWLLTSSMVLMLMVVLVGGVALKQTINNR